MGDKDDNENSEMKNTKACCVLGGRGFIGSALVDMLLRQEKTNWIVTIVDRNRESSTSGSAVLARAIDSGRASYLNLDHRLPYKSQIIQALQGVSVVFYFDEMDSFPTDFYSCYQIIVQGAKDVLSACRQCKVKQLIYNSSADVVFDDVHDIHVGDESLPYSGRYWGMVSDLRAQAEALVLAANDVDGLLTCALRPCNIFGPGDNQLVQMLVNLAKSNWAKFIIGSGNSITDFTYVDNVAHAHICAEESLRSQMVSASGKVFFVTNLEPMEFWEFASLLLGSLGYQRPVISLPVWIVSCIVYLIKSMDLKSDSKNLDPCTSSMFVAAALALRTRTFNCSEAQRHIQYKPIVSMEEAMALTFDSFSHLATDSTLGKYDFDKPSKLDELFGGKVADILLWRDEKRTFFCFLCLALLYHWFFLSGRTFISSTGKLLLLTTVLLCGNHILPLTVCGYKISRLSPSFFEISEVDMRRFFFAITYVWNNLCSIIKSLAEGEDWSIFLKAASFLYFCKLIVPHYFAATTGLVIVIAFTMGFIYEQYEKSFDGVAEVAINIARKAIIAISRNISFLQDSLSKER